MADERPPATRFKFRDLPGDGCKCALDPMPVRIVHAADDRVVFLNSKFPTADRHMSQDKPAAVTCITEFSVQHHDDV